LLARPGIGREGESVLPSERLQAPRRYPRVEFAAPTRRVENADAREPFKRYDDTTVGYTSAGESCTSPTRHKRNIVGVTPANDPENVVRRLRQDDGICATGYASARGRVPDIAGRVGPDQYESRIENPLEMGAEIVAWRRH
jgi:hypothetical protein